VIRQHLSAEGVDFDLVLTKRRGHASELAARAADDGFDVIVAAGGDGTTNEVVNGLMAAANGSVTGTLGVIPVGSGSDFANNVGIPADLMGACQRVAQGQLRLVDVCRVTVDDQVPRYFDNTVNIGFGGTVTHEARKIKRGRGLAVYLPAVLKTVFLSQAPQVTIEYDGQKVTLKAAMIGIGNGAREGGSFFCTPHAQLDDGLFDVCIVQDISRLAMLSLIPSFMNGSHVERESVTVVRAKHVVVSSPDNLIAHADGEMLCTEAHRLEFDLLSQRLQVLC
jgi:YegS/Rv2252/BmrU family lipid kinase